MEVFKCKFLQIWPAENSKTFWNSAEAYGCQEMFSNLTDIFENFNIRELKISYMNQDL